MGGDDFEKSSNADYLSKWNLFKHGGFFVIWAFVMWNLLSVKEKIVTSYDILVEPYGNKSIKFPIMISSE